ncbi:hypothetical protein KP509_04G047600 [Ceratopteris richardii]|nr:hypothetical protein KP509_04G047600 [Ceratopteris richardii]
MYAKYGFIPEAQSVFEDLVTQTEVSYTSLMSGFINHGKGHKALECFEKMEEKGMSKDAKAFVCSLKACINTLSIDKGRKLHMEVINMGLERNFIVGSVLVDMYGRCGLLVEACNIFEHLSDRDLISCATLISAYVENGHLEAALQFYDEMFAKGLPLGLVSLACMLRACSILKALAKGQEIHSFMIKIGFMEKECVISALFDMYAKCGMLREAQYVFAKMSDKSIVAWTSLIAGYTEQGHSIKAYQCFEQMQSECVYLNDSLFICVLKACAGIGDLCKSQLVHIDIEKRGLLEEDMCIGSSMIDAYAKCGSLASAQKVFDGLFVKNVVSWTALINGYTENGRNEDALFHYKLMEYEGVSPVLVTIICGLKACGALGLACKGQDLHIKAIKYGEDSELSFCHILIDMYARCGLLAEAQNVFEKSMVQDPVSCTALLTGYMEQGSFEEMLECLERLTSNGFLFLDLKIAMCILKACSKTGTIVIGSRIHAEGIRRGLDVDPMIGNIIVDMYAKCGGLAEALMVFDRLTVRNVISWTAMIAGYAEMGECENVILIFEKMLRENIEPDLITYVSVLNACSHAGLVEIGQMLFLSINHNHGLTPSAEHYVCMIDLFCRAGQITKGIVLLEDMPYDISHVAWQIVLGGCQKWGDVKLARHAFEQAIQLYELDAATYICMCNIFSNVGDLEQTFETIGVG